MSGIRNIINKYTKIAATVSDDRKELALIMAHDAHALTADRIQNEGVGADGQKFKKYSKKPMPYWFLKPSDFNSPNKITKFKKNAREKKNNASYDALRKAYGLPTDKRTLTFDGDMFKSIFVEIESHNDLVTIAIIKSKDRENQDKVNHNSRQLGINILSFGEDEKQLISELNEERVNKLLKSN